MAYSLKNQHLNHAIKSAYEGLINDKYYPSYFLNFSLPKNTIDVNIHPNKTEIRFENDQSIYAVLKSSIKHALGQFNISPSIDFDNGVKYNTPYSYKDKPPIEISNYKKYRNNQNNNKKILKSNKHKSSFLKSNKIKKMINIGSFTSILVLSGLLIRYIQKKK